ncbi:hypothetical protein AP9108_34975 [Arthrospira sp. PCC 9108]|nr:hypothetical protein AP9108_34975 [Arthrospira sp. PCC 9108]
MFNQLMRLMGRFRRWLTQVWDKFIDWVDPPPPPRSNPPRLPDDEYEWLFRQLLTKVGQGWKGDQVRRWLRRNEYRVTKSRWEEWSPRFHPNPKDAEISRQLLLLAQLDGDYISQIAANLLGETRPKPPPEKLIPLTLSRLMLSHGLTMDANDILMGICAVRYSLGKKRSNLNPITMKLGLTEG